jgi:hypothetical protein
MRGISPGERERAERRWQAVWIAITALFVLAAALNMLHVRGGFLTSHLADLVVPAWLYVATRGLAGRRDGTMLSRALGGSPWLAATVVFGASVLTELSQKVWPHGIFRGTFDPLDLAAFAAGTGACLVADLASGGGRGGIPPQRPTSSPGEVTP